jgi:hypothetical protein
MLMRNNNGSIKQFQSFFPDILLPCTFDGSQLFCWFAYTASSLLLIVFYFFSIVHFFLVHFRYLILLVLCFEKYNN